VNDTPDPLETELAAFRPQPVSADLHRRVGERLNAPGGPRRWTWGLAVVGVLIVVGAVALLGPRRKEPAPPVPPTLPEVVPAPAVVPESDSPAPTVLAYQRAFARSPEDLNALLDRQAATRSNSKPLAAGSFARSPAALDALLGDD
jgi:hypothetical protein